MNKIFIIMALVLTGISAKDTSSIVGDGVLPVDSTLSFETIIEDSLSSNILDLENSKEENLSVNIAADTTNIKNMEIKENDKPKVIKKKFNYRRQVGTALAMMAFIGIILSLGSSLNPK